MSKKKMLIIVLFIFLLALFPLSGFSCSNQFMVDINNLSGKPYFIQECEDHPSKSMETPSSVSLDVLKNCNLTIIGKSEMHLADVVLINGIPKIKLWKWRINRHQSFNIYQNPNIKGPFILSELSNPLYFFENTKMTQSKEEKKVYLYLE